MGTFTNMTQRHDASSVKRPPATSPMAPPAADTVVYSAMARTRSAPSANLVVNNDRAAGAARAAPSPWSARAASSIEPVVARPPAMELTENNAMPVKNERRRPIRSPARAPRSSRPPKVRM
jgi:hypothetical protein